MGQRPIVKGITNYCSLNARCERCDSNLDNSLWNEIKVIYCLNRKKKFVCVKCATRITKNNTVLVTILEIERFVSSLNKIKVLVK